MGEIICSTQDSIIRLQRLIMLRLAANFDSDLLLCTLRLVTILIVFVHPGTLLIVGTEIL